MALSNPLSRYEYHPQRQQIVNWMVTVGSVFLCLLLLPMRIPGMVLLGVTPNWLLIWVVAWSMKRTVFQGAIAGLVLGLIQDGMTSPDPTHTISLIVVGVLTACLQKQRYLQEDFISVALIVFGMTILAEVISALQFFFLDLTTTSTGTFTIQQRQQAALASAIVSSLWAPAVYYPLNYWWARMKVLHKRAGM